MKLFKYEDYEVKVAPEALLLKPFKKIWDRDKSKHKDKATQELSFLYFYCDPRSDYQYITDDETRLDAVKRGIGFANDWKPDTIIKAAITFYNTFDSNAARLLRLAAREIDKAQQALDSMTPTDYKSIKEQFGAMKIIPEIASMIQEAEKALNTEDEFGEATGSIEKGMFEDGLDEVAEWVNSQSNKT
jgi:hypothetical protein